jgi:hypothetical protein
MKLTEQQLLDIAGVDTKVLAENRKINENALADEVERVYGVIGKAAVDLARTYFEMMEDYQGVSIDELSPEIVKEYVRDQITDFLDQLLDNNEFKDYLNQQIGKAAQSVADPTQRTLDV